MAATSRWKGMLLLASSTLRRANSRRWKQIIDFLVDFQRIKGAIVRGRYESRKKEKPHSPPPAEPQLLPYEPDLPEVATLRQLRIYSAFENLHAREATMSGVWIILGRVPSVSDEITAGEEVSFHRRDPMHISFLTLRRSDYVSAVPTEISPDLDDYPYVVAVDDSTGIFLLHALARHPDAALGTDPGPSNQQRGADVYLICDVRTCKATPLLQEHARRLLYVGNVGLIRAPSTSDEDEEYHMVAELQPFPGTDRAILHCFYTARVSPAPKEVNYPPCDRPWGSNGVISYAGMLWWIDLSYGLLACDPFSNEPEMLFVALPGGCELAARTEDLARRRCVRVSDGKLLYVQIHDDSDGAPKVSTWILSVGAMGLGCWELRHEVRFSTIWNSISCWRTPMAGVTSVPVLALVHPKKPDVVCFFQFRAQHSWIFAVDLASKSVLECQEYTLPHLARTHHSSRFVHAWELPSASEQVSEAGESL